MLACLREPTRPWPCKSKMHDTSPRAVPPNSPCLRRNGWSEYNPPTTHHLCIYYITSNAYMFVLIGATTTTHTANQRGPSMCVHV